MDEQERKQKELRLASAEAAFEHLGGRGVDLAEEIDQLRAELEADDKAKK